MSSLTGKRTERVKEFYLKCWFTDVPTGGYLDEPTSATKLTSKRICLSNIPIEQRGELRKSLC